MKIKLKEITDKTKRIAIKTGNFLKSERENFDSSKIIEKNSHDYVSYVDQEAEKLIINELTSVLPSAGFITEEGTGKYNGEKYYWVIDPLDGTTNFIHDNAPYCVSIALMQDKEIIVAVIYEVCRDECFYAYKGGGAYLNDKPIHVSSIKDIDQSLIGLDLPYESQKYKPLINHLIDNLYGKASSIRLNGSAAISLCYVACGRYEIWGEAFIKTWDYSAGILIVEEAGGLISDYSGKPFVWGDHDIVASNGHTHSYFCNLLKPFLKEIKE